MEKGGWRGEGGEGRVDRRRGEGGEARMLGIRGVGDGNIEVEQEN